MDSPFFTNRCWYRQPDHPTHRPFNRGVPVHDIGPTPVHVKRPAERASVPKVVRVPVQFFGSHQLDRAGAASRIQKVFRGFSVRKNLRKIKDIKLQVDDVEERLKRSDVVDLVKKDPKERLRMNEGLMALLLKLDSISGVDFGVRVCRKAVIRKAIALQERIDAIVSGDSERSEIVDLEKQGEKKSVPGVIENQSDAEDNEDACVGVRCVDGGDDEDAIVDVGVDCEVKLGENVEIAKKRLNDGEEEEEENEGRTDRELLEKMMKENEKMMSMMNQLFERSEMQTRTINALTHRVGLLEKAFICDKLRKKKKARPACTRN